jgi:putative endonuclease
MVKKSDSYSKKELGKIGEAIAQKYLLTKGYKIRHTNWHFGHKELDIVATKDNTLVIVEVKTRYTDYWEEPKEAVRRKKQKFMIQAAEAYVFDFNLNIDVQFDIISIVLQNGKHELEHIEDAFQPSF